MKTKTITTYISEDGKEFDTLEKCLDHEKTLGTDWDRIFDDHFTLVHGVSDNLAIYISGDCGFNVYAFTAFDGWKDVLSNIDKGYVVDDSTFIEHGSVKEGKKYFAFFSDEIVYIVSLEELKRQIAKDIDDIAFYAD